MESRVCDRCKKPIANQSLECERCKKLFHPGCVKPYATYKYADTCCKALAATLDAPLTPVSEPNAHPFDFASGVSATQVQAQLQGQTETNVLLQKLFNQLKDSDAKLSAFIEDQRCINREINDKLSKLELITDTVAQSVLRIDKLEQESSALAREVRDLKAAQSVPRDENENKLIISGVPNELSITPTELVGNILKVLDIPDLSSHILNVRSMARKRQTVMASDGSSSPGSTGSFIVTLSSGAVRDVVIASKRVKRSLKQSEVCSGGSNQNIYVNELLSRTAYDLLQRVKKIAKERSYKYVWTRGSRICVRLSDGALVIFIDSDSDLAKIN
ncbi:uncharacterized protein LOC143902941 [Temnothorax americanus]|uniref:uncharacterized protein LOC143902941 n=1 Tax=Temnothorax americanus TaxID=1964332 RepID=UPI00406899B0